MVFHIIKSRSDIQQNSGGGGGGGGGGLGGGLQQAHTPCS